MQTIIDHVDGALYTLALVVVAATCLAGILCHPFKDNLFQRCGMALIAAGCVIRLAFMLIGEPVEKTRYLVMYGLALYALGTAWKVYSFNRRPRNRRRS